MQISKEKLLKHALGLSLLFGCIAVAQAQTSTIYNPVADTYVRSGSSADSNYGSDANLIANMGNTSKLRWSYLQFDLTGLDMANLTGARLELWNNGLGNTLTLTHTYNVYGLLNAYDTWGESTLTWNNDPNRDTGGGANTLDKTHTYGGAELADFQSNGTTTGNQLFETAFDVTSRNVLDFLQASSGNLSNVTFIIYEDNPVDVNGDAWDSREASHPARLTLVTSVPEPSSLVLVGAGLLAFFAIFRFRRTSV